MNVPRQTTRWLCVGLLALCGRELAAQEQSQRAAKPEVAKPPASMFRITTASAEAKEHAMQGQRAIDMGKFVEANTHFKRAVQADPNFAFGYLQAANSSNSLEDFAANLEQASRHAEHASEVERLLIKIAKKGFDSDFEGQLEVAQQLVRVEPNNPRSWLALAGVQSQLRQEGAARATLAKAIKLAPKFAPAHTQLGGSYLLVEPRDLTKAEEHSKHAVSLEPDEPLPHDLLGDTYRAQNELKKARDAYTRAAELDPDNGLPLQQRGHVNSFLGNYEAARSDYDAAIKLGKANEKAAFAVWRALVHVHAGNSRAGVEELERLVAAIDGMGIPEPEGQKIFALSEQATIALHNKMMDVAQRAIERRSALVRQEAERAKNAEFRRTQEADVVYFQGLLAARKGDYTAAANKAKEIMRLVEPNRDARKNERAHELLGLVSLLKGKHGEAVSHYEQADPNDPYVTYHHALALEGAGRSDKAKKLFQKVATYNFNTASLALVRKDAAKRAA